MQEASSNLPIKELSFEDALKELEEIVKNMDNGNVPLEKSILLYERGESLKQHCSKLLQAAESKIEIIKTNNTNEPLATKPYLEDDL